MVHNYYRSQRSCGKVMFLHLFVILSTGGVYPSMHLGRHPPGETPIPGRHLPGQTFPGQTPPWADTPEQTPPWADTPADPPPQQTATAADGTYLTGMHSYSFYYYYS